MGQSVNYAVCKVCNESFTISLEWLSREVAIKYIREAKCPNCKSKEWHFTDEMGNKETK